MVSNDKDFLKFCVLFVLVFLLLGCNGERDKEVLLKRIQNKMNIVKLLFQSNVTEFMTKLQEIETQVHTAISQGRRNAAGASHTDKLLERKLNSRHLVKPKPQNSHWENKKQALRHYNDFIKKLFHVITKKKEHKKNRRIFNQHKIIHPTYNKHLVFKYEDFISKVFKSTAAGACSEIINETCQKVRLTAQTTCSDGKALSFEKICNGIIDCSDQSDEKDCVSKVLNKAQRLNETISNIGSLVSGKCLKNNDRDTLKIEHDALWDDLNEYFDQLKNHLEENHNDTNVNKSNSGQDPISFIYSTKYGSKLVNWLSRAIEGSLCVSHSTPKSSKPISYNEINSGDDIDVSEKLKPQKCECNGQICTNNCNVLCNRTCWQKYRLNYRECNAVDGGKSITLDKLCDGKLDCYDESDETNCKGGDSYSKFEVIPIFNWLQENLAKKANALEYITCRNLLVDLTLSIRELQKMVIQKSTDSQKIKKLWEESFAAVEEIYETLMKTSTFRILDDAFTFLNALNEKFVIALEHSYNGDIHRRSSDTCICVNGFCSVPRCSEKCKHMCVTEQIILNFSCNSGNVSLPSDVICDGTTDCVNGEDEKSCNQDVCRAHHLVMLRHKLQSLDTKTKDYDLHTWKQKAINDLMAIEGKARPNHKAIAGYVNNLLKDLVTTYGSVEYHVKFTRETALKEFIEAATIVKNTLKTCVN